MITSLLSKANANPQEVPFVEPKIKTLVDQLNSTGLIQVITCCEGHRYSVQAPVIYFNAPIEAARELERWLRFVCASKESPLNYFWTVSARFNENFELRYRLHAPSLDSYASDTGLLSSMQWIHPISARKDRDLVTLSRLLPPLLLQLGNGNKPSVCDC